MLKETDFFLLAGLLAVGLLRLVLVRGAKGQDPGIEGACGMRMGRFRDERFGFPAVDLVNLKRERKVLAKVGGYFVSVYFLNGRGENRAYRSFSRSS